MKQEDKTTETNVENSDTKKTGKKKIGIGKVLIGGMVIGVPLTIIAGFTAIISSMIGNYNMIKDADEFTKTNPEEIMNTELSASDLSEMGYFKNLNGSQFVNECRMETLRDKKELSEDFGKYTTVNNDAAATTECIKRELAELNAKALSSNDSFSTRKR